MSSDWQLCVPCFRKTRSTGDQTTARMGGALRPRTLTRHALLHPSGVSTWRVVQTRFYTWMFLTSEGMFTDSPNYLLHVPCCGDFFFLFYFSKIKSNADACCRKKRKLGEKSLLFVSWLNLVMLLFWIRCPLSCLLLDAICNSIHTSHFLAWTCLT